MKSVNPVTGEVLKEFPPLTLEQVSEKINQAWKAFQTNRKSSLQMRKEKFTKLAQILEDRKHKYATLITLETGKTYREATSEILKCAKHCRWIVENMERFVSQEVSPTEASKSYVEYQPLGVIFFITPYNFPFWLVFKGGAPALSVGNAVLNRLASQCPQCGYAIEEAFRDAGFDNYEFQFLQTTREQTEYVIAHKYVRGVSFTGSTSAGAEIASLAGKYCKKSIMELGGSDPFVVLADADLDLAVECAVRSRLGHVGQVCNCAKRFIIDEKVYEEFKKKLVERVKKVKIGDPMKEETDIGPLGSMRIADRVRAQWNQALNEGAKVIHSDLDIENENLKKRCYVTPQICEVDENNILFQEEVFGPIFALTKFSNEEEALRLANGSKYGLGGAVMTKNLEKADKFIKELEVGAVFVNTPVVSDPRLPSGGIKASGYGRECGIIGAREFTNEKMVWVK